MKFTAVVPVVKYETKTYDVDVSENEKKIIKAYEKWYDDMSDKNQQALIDTLTRDDNKFDSDVDNFEDWVNYIIRNIRTEIYRKEMWENENEAIYDVHDIHGLADGDFNFLD